MTEAAEIIKHLAKKAKQELAAVASATELEAWRVEYLGRKGAVPTFLRTVKDLPEAQRKSAGQQANELRHELEIAFQEKRNQLGGGEEAALVVDDQITFGKAPGHLHPLTLTIRRVQDIFSAMGFMVVEGPEVEEAKYAFDDLNIPLEHPARSEMDTFYVEARSKKQEASTLVLRPHTSSVQTRAVLENDLVPPFRILSPGRVFRAERTDATHETTFYQFEGLVVGEGSTIADFKGIIEAFYSTFFEQDVRSRLRPSYFPFVEPGFEVDISCVFCAAKGCRVCKHTGWIEVMGAGMVHPNVLRNMNIDPAQCDGFAFGGAVDRLAMLRYGIDDIRLFWSGDIRFLKQFS